LNPALKFFPTQQSPIGRAVHQSSLSEDIYLILSGFSDLDRNQATLKVLVRPLVVWMWIGGFVIALGTLICIAPIGKPVQQEDQSESPSLESAICTLKSDICHSERSED
jgi:cytochrome c-type biogenesis protein CcmF